MKRFAFLLLFLVCCTAVQKPSSQVTFANNTVFNVELAMTDAEREQGLMYRTSMPSDQGMLFIFSDEQPRSFWMKNTKIPLDMLFIAKNMTVIQVTAEVPPCVFDPCPVYSSPPAQYVLELNAGVAKESGIQKGSELTLSQ